MPYEYIQLDKNGQEPLYHQLYCALRDAIARENGALLPGQRLPSIRQLCEDLHVSRTTVESAYQQLCVEGYLEARPQRGYFVLAAGGAPRAHPAPLPPQAPRPKARYNFGTDAVDAGCADLKTWRRHIRDVLNEPEALVRYGDPQGEPALREALCAYSGAARGVVCSPAQIVIGAGTQPLLSLLCGLLQGKAGAVAFEEPGFLQAEQVFLDCGIGVVHLPCDESGLTPQELRESGVRAAFVSPSNLKSRGGSIPLARRQALLSWAKDTGGLFIEDDYNGELRYRARPIPAMQGMAADGQVVYLGSFSKLLLPSVRIGYMVLPSPLLPLYRARAERYNQTASKIEQLALASYIQKGELARHLRRLRKVYAQKSQTLLHALRQAFGTRIELHLQETLLCVSARLSGDDSPETLVARARACGVRVRPGPDGCVTLGFAGIPIADIAPGVAALQAAWA